MEPGNVLYKGRRYNSQKARNMRGALCIAHA